VESPIFLFAQSTQRKRSEALAQYLASAPLVIVADSFQSIYTDKADLILPIQALYETRATLTSVENYAQVSPGVSLNHPNQRSIHRGGELVAGPLKLL
jgi:NADH dehydrogenase/NADH:ubiquinone oxidoreductase subunit G